MESKLLRSVRYNTNHVLYQLLPPEKYIHYNLRQQSHSLTLPSEENNLTRKNFLHGMLGPIKGYLLADLCYCILFHLAISMHLLRTLHPMLHCICMHVDVVVCVCQT